jgi:hypothetical protein
MVVAVVSNWPAASSPANRAKTTAVVGKIAASIE